MARDRLDSIGLLYLWGKLKSLFASQSVIGDTPMGTTADTITGAVAELYNTCVRLVTCSTSASTAAKVGAIAPGTTFTLKTGSRVTVSFTNVNTADSPTLNVASTGAKNILYKGTQITTGSEKELLADIVDFVYDGTYWNLIAGGTSLEDISDSEIDDIVGDVDPSDTGYITSAEIDEIVGNVGSSTLVYLLNSIYPVGTYYTTADDTFDPNNTFMGVWTLDSSTSTTYTWVRDL